MLRMALDHFILKENIHVLFHAIVNKVQTSKSGENNERILVDKVWAQTKLGEIEFTAKNIVDATGDADIVFHAGGEVIIGRKEDGLVQPATLNFRMGNISKINESSSSITKKILEEKSHGNPLTQRDNCLKFRGNNAKEFHFNQTRVSDFDFTDPFDMTAAEIEGRIQSERFINFLRSSVKGYKNSVVMNLGTQLGIRETRRIVGEYILSEEDLLSTKQFEDRIALGNYSIDIHDPKGTGTTDIRRIPKGKWYSIPYRSLIPKGFDNLIVAGRPISSTHVAHSAIRVMSICSLLGQAAGTASAMIIMDSKKSFNSISVNILQDKLRNDGAILE